VTETDRTPGIALETLWAAEAGQRGDLVRGRPMPAELSARYGGELLVPIRDDAPTLIVNFVSSLDGIVALGPGAPPGGGVISGSFEPDRFVMALLRATADVLLMGSGTAAGSSSVNWVAEQLEPAHADALRMWRREMGLGPHPTAVIVTGSGELRLGRRGVDDPEIPVIFATTPRGARRLRGQEFPAHVTIEAVGDGDAVAPAELAAFLDRYRGQVVLSEGGPHLLGGLVDADLVDELFLTVAPQVVGRAGGRLGLVEGLELPPDGGRWHDLVSVKRAGEHLFLRYRRRR
jgi:riboflavin biosynthesis pyrimidine reductase